MGKDLGFIAVLLLVAAGFIGWGMNVYKIFTIDIPLAEFGIAEVMRIVGIFVAPLGAVMGFF